MMSGQVTPMRLAGVLAAAALIATGAASLAPAAPLDNETCAQLKREVVDLDGIGARNNMAKGPAWAKANLSSAQLEQIKKLIEIEEAIAFRCMRPKSPTEAQAPAKAKVKVKAASKTSTQDPTPAAVTAGAAKPKPQPPAAGAGEAAATAPCPAKAKPKPAARPADAETTAAAPPPAKPKPKPKPQDTFIPAN